MRVKCIDDKFSYCGLAAGQEYDAFYLNDKKKDVVINGVCLPLSLFEVIEEDKHKQIGGTHYGSNDTIQFARDNFPPEQLEGFFRINVIKYVDRYDRKNGVEDLKKAQHYLQMLIELKS